MKGHDIGLLLKLVSLHKQEQNFEFDKAENGLEDAYLKSDLLAQYTARMLEVMSGIS